VRISFRMPEAAKLPAAVKTIPPRQTLRRNDPTPHNGAQDFNQRVESEGLSPAQVPALVREVIAAPGQPLDTAARSVMESRLGHDFSGVRVHTDARAAVAARAINARAYTAGHNVVFGAGQYSPGTATGQNLLAHELTHVTQQAAAPKGGLLPGGRRVAGVAVPLSIQRQVATEGDKPAPTARGGDIVRHTEVRGHEIITTETLGRESLQSKLVTVFDLVTMTQKQRLFRRSAQSPAWTDVTAEAMRDTYLNPPGVEAGEVSVEWNMPLARPASSGGGAGQMLAEAVTSEVPPSLVIPYVKDSILTEHFEFTPPGQNPYQHWMDTIARRWSATGARKTSFWLNKVVSAANLGVEATGAVTAASKGASAIEAAAEAERPAFKQAARLSGSAGPPEVAPPSRQLPAGPPEVAPPSRQLPAGPPEVAPPSQQLPAKAPQIVMGDVKTATRNSYRENLKHISEMEGRGIYNTNGNIGMAMYDPETGDVTLQVFGTAAPGQSRRIIWEGPIGKVKIPPGRTPVQIGNDVEEPVRDLVRKATGQQFPYKRSNAPGPDLRPP